jgi:hypothetical protein
MFCQTMIGAPRRSTESDTLLDRPKLGCEKLFVTAAPLM